MCDESVQVTPITKKVKQTQLLSYRKPHSKNFNLAFHHYARRIQKYNRSPFPICSILLTYEYRRSSKGVVHDNWSVW